MTSLQMAPFMPVALLGMGRVGHRPGGLLYAWVPLGCMAFGTGVDIAVAVVPRGLSGWSIVIRSQVIVAILLGVCIAGPMYAHKRIERWVTRQRDAGTRWCRLCGFALDPDDTARCPECGLNGRIARTSPFELYPRAFRRRQNQWRLRLGLAAGAGGYSLGLVLQYLMLPATSLTPGVVDILGPLATLGLGVVGVLVAHHLRTPEARYSRLHRVR